MTACLFMFSVISSQAGSHGWLIYYEGSFRGKVIDSETKEPIEGAVVVAIYHVRLFGPILPLFSDAVVADVHEVVTDIKGEFFIPSNIFFYPLPTTLGGEYTSFIIFKPGYGSFPNDYEFIVFPVKNVNVLKSVKWKDQHHIESIEQGIEKEGIVFSKKHFMVLEKIDKDTYFKKFGLYSPFIPLENAERKVKNLEIPFDYEIIEDLDNVWRIGNSALPETFKNYTVVGLKRLKTWEERNKDNMISPTDDEKQWPLLHEMIKKEDEWLKNNKGWRR